MTPQCRVFYKFVWTVCFDLADRFPAWSGDFDTEGTPVSRQQEISKCGENPEIQYSGVFPDFLSEKTTLVCNYILACIYTHMYILAYIGRGVMDTLLYAISYIILIHY